DAEARRHGIRGGAVRVHTKNDGMRRNGRRGADRVVAWHRDTAAGRNLALGRGEVLGRHGYPAAPVVEDRPKVNSHRHQDLTMFMRTSSDWSAALKNRAFASYAR